jgi:hypothetical protein
MSTPTSPNKMPSEWHNSPNQVLELDNGKRPTKTMSGTFDEKEFWG